ncbi:MAG: mechanosensitive ion channel protein MscS, partial [Stutzerimonas stutzeri]
MSDDLAGWLEWLRAHPELQTLLASATLIFAAWLSNWIVKRILVRGLYHLLQHTRENKLQ